jgi:cytidylate kinase
VFLTARLDVRAERRHGEDLDRDYERVARQMVERDTTDSNRDASPLTVADGALVVDTSELSVEEIVDRLAALL